MIVSDINRPTEYTKIIVNEPQGQMTEIASDSLLTCDEDVQKYSEEDHARSPAVTERSVSRYFLSVPPGASSGYFQLRIYFKIIPQC